MRNTNTTIWRILGCAFVVAVYFFGLGALPFLGPDEPRYAEVAREMLERGDWVTPTLGGFNWFEKPVLLYWLEIIGYKLFGINEFAARFGSTIFGLATIFTIYFLCRFVERNPRLKVGSQTENYKLQKLYFQFSDIAFLISSTSLGLLAFSRAASFDIILTFPVTAALVSYFITENYPNSSSRKSLFAFYFFIGIALLAKGLIGIVLPFGVIFTYQILSLRLPSKRFFTNSVWGIFVTCAVASIWYAPVILRHGYEFVDEFFIQQHFARYVSNKYAHEQPFLYFFLVLPLMVLPWLPFWLSPIVSRLKTRISNENTSSVNFNSLYIYSTAWVIFPLAFFSFSGSKLPGYILPALPALILLTSLQVFDFVRDNRKRAFVVKALACAILVLIPLIITFGGESFTRGETVKFLMQTVNEKGFTSEKVLNLHDISHSLEFYANGRLVRNDDGKQRKFQGVSEIVDFIKQNSGERVLVVVPLDRIPEMTNDSIESNFVADNGAFALFAVRVR